MAQCCTPPRSPPPPGAMDRSGSFFKLIDTFASELGELEQEMVQTSPVEDKEPMVLQGLEGEVSGVYLQSPHCGGGAGGGGGGERDSGYDSLRRRMSVLDRLTQTHAVWLLLPLSEEEAKRILLRQPPGVFLVRKSATLQRKVLSVRVNEHESECPISHFPVKESQYTFSLEGSGISFADLFRLVAFYCISRDVLPFTLKLPEAIASAKTQKELEEVAQLGAGFWDSALSSQRPTSSPAASRRPVSRTLPPSHRACGAKWTQQDAVASQVASSSPPAQQQQRHHDSAPPTLRSRPGRSQTIGGGGALCFVNPLFLQTHHHRQPPDAETTTTAASPPPPLPSSPPCGAAPTPELGSSSSNPGDVDLTSSSPPPPSEDPPEDKTAGSARSRQTPPPRPPPPRSMPPRRRPAPPPPAGVPPTPASATVAKPKSMPENASASPAPAPLTTHHHLSPSRRPAPARPSTMGAKSSSSSSSPKKASSPPIPVPSSSSSAAHHHPPPPRPKKPDLESHRCHIALDDETIAKALSRAKLPATPLENGTTPPTTLKSGARCEGGGQRLSDMSMSTSSSDSLDFSQSPAGGFSLGLGLPAGPAPRRKRRDTADDSSEDEEEDEEEEEEEEEEEDYGVSLENDLDAGLRRPPFKSRRRVAVGRGIVGAGLSGGSFILPRALKGHFRKVSGVFSSLMTPEKRAVKRITELSRNKSSYFGSLVQDYVSFVQENRAGHTSAMDLLQTLRQFMTQMKAYLRQSSELDPPIESLIPEDQIDQVLEKAMHKCVLKPLKSVVEVALHDFQVSSGAWQQLKENLALAKAKRPQDLGVDGAVPPDTVAIEKIRHKFINMRKLYSPEKKVSLLLRVCKLIYTIMQDNSGRMYGADDFLPMLTYVVAQCDMPQLDTDIQYMMELLDPSLLHGEGGYYLTSAYGAMALIKNFQEEQAARVLSSEARNTLHQWHRRRTTQRMAPSVDDFQNYLRVALQEVDTGCTAKTLIVQPYSTTEEICSVCAFKFKIADPENYALFLLTEDTSQQLAPDTHPQRIKAELHSRPQAHTFHFVYRRKVANLNVCIPDNLQNGNCTST